MNFRHIVTTVALVGAVACGGEEEGQRVELGQPAQEGGRSSWSPELTARVDSGNTAYAAGDYEEAAAVFTAITEDYPDMGVAWFGLSMAEGALGNDEAAQEALARAEARAPGLGRMHDAAADSAARIPMGMPEDHPELPSDHPPVGDTGG